MTSNYANSFNIQSTTRMSLDNNNLRKESQLVSKLRDGYNSGMTRNLEFRKSQLKALNRMLEDNEELIISALKKDLNKPCFESVVCEIDFVQNEIRGMLMGMDEWSSPQYVSKTLVTLFDTAYIQAEPYGVVLIIGAWNYPVMTLLTPLTGAIASGNAALIKPSEVSGTVEQVIHQLIPRYLDPSLYQVFTGGPEETQEILKERFDYVFFTGSPMIGQKVSMAVAKHMTPITLELGGKTPVFIDDSFRNLDILCRRLLWGKYVNAGQTCVAPDYIICTKGIQEELIETSIKIMKEFFGSNPEKSQSFGRIINARNFNRLRKLLSSASGKVEIGGEVNEQEKYIAPTIISNVSPSDPVMQEEIFGPILPVISVKDVEEAVEFINDRDKPLSLYIFSKRKDVIDKLANGTSSGSICANDTVIHLTVDTLPFGGIGKSGVGKYRGKYTFDTFSHHKPILIRSMNPLLEMLGAVRYPPYTDRSKNLLKMLVKKRSWLVPGGMIYAVCFALGMSSVFLYQHFNKDSRGD